jgi:peptidoglycan hydrolase CwlO-like protein
VAVTYKNTWDEIQEELSKLLHSRGDERLLPKYAFEIKSAIETIEQQKRIAELQQHLIAQQQENVSYTKNLSEYQRESTYYSGNLVQQQKKLVWPTRILAFFTLALFLATVSYGVVNYLDWRDSRDQTVAIERFSDISERQETSLRNLSQSLRLIPNSISDFSESVQALQSIQEEINTLREDHQKLEKNQKRVMKKIKLRVK